ncbi:MAG: tetratricopeptide repeat protein [Pyrinomonadaceae bacterium]
MLAFCYWNEGEVSECEAILDFVEAEFGKNLLHPVYLQICINRLLIYFWNQDIKPALKIIEEINAPMRFCTNVRLQAMFHNQAGIFYTNTAEYDKAVFHLNEAIRFAEKTNNKVFVGINLNNLSFLYKDIKEYDTAFKYISESIDKFKRTGHQGFLSHALDTKALIYLDWNKTERALETINQSIEYFNRGEDFRGLTDALWTKIRCLFRLGQTEEGFNVFAELGHIAQERIGEVAVQKFTKKLTEEVYVLRHLPLAEESAEFRKTRVAKALVEANGTVGVAAKILGLNSHQALSDILNKQFPGLLQELGFSRRARRGTVMKSSQAETVNSDYFLSEREITRLILPGSNFSFDFNISTEKFETFYFDKYLMRNFGIDSASIVAVVPVSKLKAGQNIVVCDKDVFTVAKVEYNDWSGIYFISDARGEPLPLDEKNVVGEPVGYCLFSKTDEKFIEFSKLEG